MEDFHTDDQAAIEAAEKAGFDVGLIESNLALSPAERWRQHSLALEMVFEMQQARLNRDTRLQSPTASAR